ncbi:MAG: hypothetical protein JJT94_08835, partial [Bernardetiaceae bacterium]|nr:hypothetical protein [Bernardetiaceae bacterium]
QKQEINIESFLSPARLSRYVQVCHGNMVQAIELYQIQARFSASFVPLLSVFEVSLRNAISSHLELFFEDKNSTATQIISVLEKKIKRKLTQQEEEYVFETLPFQTNLGWIEYLKYFLIWIIASDSSKNKEDLIFLTHKNLMKDSKYLQEAAEKTRNFLYKNINKAILKTEDDLRKKLKEEQRVLLRRTNYDFKKRENKDKEWARREIDKSVNNRLLKQPITNAQVVSNTELGFWTHFFDYQPYNMFKDLYKNMGKYELCAAPTNIFNKKNLQKFAIENRIKGVGSYSKLNKKINLDYLQVIREFRNRIAHNEPIIFTQMRKSAQSNVLKANPELRKYDKLVTIDISKAEHVYSCINTILKLLNEELYMFADFLYTVEKDLIHVNEYLTYFKRNKV